MVKVGRGENLMIMLSFPGIATEMIKARISMLQCLGLQLTSTGFASIGAQKAAEKAGCCVDYKIRYYFIISVVCNRD